MNSFWRRFSRWLAPASRNPAPPSFLAPSPSRRSALDEFRAFNAPAAVAVYLGKLEAGLTASFVGAQAAMDKGDSAGAFEHLHCLKVELGTLGASAGAELAARLESICQAGGNGASDLPALKCEVEAALAWLRAQPERSQAP